MPASTQHTKSLALAAVACLLIFCMLSLGESFKILSTSSMFLGGNEKDAAIVKRSWESEQGPFSLPRPDDEVNNKASDEPDSGPIDDAAGDVADLINNNRSDSNDKLGIPGLPIPIETPLSIVACLFGGCSSSSAGTTAQQPGATPSGGGGLFPSVLSILAGATPAPGSPGGNGGALGGLLSALSHAAPSENQPAPGVTAPPTSPIGSGGLLPGLGVLDGVASALGGVLGSSDPSNGDGEGLLGQLSANLLNPIASIAANPASILANPTSAISNLQSQVSAVLNSIPSALAAGVQLASNVGGDLAGALNATTDLLDSVPDVAGGVADQVGSLLHAAPGIATGIPSAALDAVNQVESILNSSPGVVAGLGGNAAGVLNGLKNDLNNAVASAVPQVSALAGVVNGQVVGILPSALQPLVSGALSSLATATIASSTSGVPGAATTAPPHLASLLSSLSSSIQTAASAAGATDSYSLNSVASSALSGLSSLISQISQLSLTNSNTPATPPAGATAAPVPTPESPVAETTIYYVQTITALITLTETKTSVITECPTAFASYTLKLTSTRGSGGLEGSSGDGSDTASCPGGGYTCDNCLGGIFCPPVPTPALPAPCGYGWPCYHCDSGWFCVPSSNSPARRPNSALEAYSTTTPNIKLTSVIPAANEYKYVGCYEDGSDRALRDAQLLSMPGGMTSNACIDFCRTQGFNIAGTEFAVQCFCGDTLLNSHTISETQCNMTCTGDPTNATVCGGSWALSIWSLDGSIQQALSPGPGGPISSVVSATSTWQHAGGVRISTITVLTSVYAWPPLVSSITPVIPTPTAMDVSGLEAAILSAVASQASGMALIDSARASGIIESVSIMLNLGMSQIASELSLIATKATPVPLITGPSILPLGPGPMVPSTTVLTGAMLPVETANANKPNSPTKSPNEIDSDKTAAHAVSTVPTMREGSYIFPSLPTHMRARRASRRRAHRI